MNRKFLALIISTIMLWLSVSPINLFSQELKPGSVIISSDPGFRIFLNEEFKGFTLTEQDGLLIKNIEAGSYHLKATKRDVKDILIEITVQPGIATEVLLSDYVALENPEVSEQTYLHVIFPTRISQRKIDFFLNRNKIEITANDHIIIPKPYEGRYEFIVEEGINAGQIFTKKGSDSYIKIRQIIDIFTADEITENEFKTLTNKKQFNTKKFEL